MNSFAYNLYYKFLAPTQKLSFIPFWDYFLFFNQIKPKFPFVRNLGQLVVKTQTLQRPLKQPACKASICWNLFIRHSFNIFQCGTDHKRVQTEKRYKPIYPL